MPPVIAGVVDRDDVAGALAEGVGDLVDDRAEAPVGVMAEIDAERVEDEAEQARIAHQHDAIAKPARARPRATSLGCARRPDGRRRAP